MFLSNQCLTKPLCSLGLICAGGIMISLTASAAFAENVAAPEIVAEEIVETKGLASAQKAGARGNLTGLFRSPRRLSSVAVSPALNSPEVAIDVKPAMETDVAGLVTVAPVGGTKTAKTKRSADALSALIAANSAPEALLNADPNSRLGKIAAYRIKVLEVELLGRDLDEAVSVLNKLDLPEATVEDLTAQLSKAAAEKTNAQIEIAEIRTGLDAVGGVNGELENDLALARASLARKSRVLLDVAAQKNSAQMFDQTMRLVQQAEGDLAKAKAEATALLEAASNKPVTGAVVAEVHRLLGLPVIE